MLSLLGCDHGCSFEVPSFAGKIAEGNAVSTLNVEAGKNFSLASS